MNVLLVQLYDGGEVPPVYPLGLAYLASSLDGHNVRILDQNTVEGNVFQETVRQAAAMEADVVGISIRNLRLYSASQQCSLFQDQLQLTVDVVRSDRPDTVVVAGGAAFSMFPRHFMTSAPGIDFGVFLEGEQTFPRLLENLGQPDNVPGIYWRSVDGLRFNNSYAPPSFERLKAPRRDLVPVDRYKGLDAVGVLSKRGCPLACCYCAYPTISGHQLRLREPSDVVDEIEALVKQWGVREFTFADNVFNIPADHAKAICVEIVNRNLTVRWSAWFNEQFLDDDLLQAASDAGCVVAELSPDGYTASSLRWLNKNITTADIRRGVRQFRKFPSISVFYNFILGIPGQGLVAWARQGLFVLWAEMMLGRRFLGARFNPLTIEPNTQLQRVALAEGLIDERTDLFATVHYEQGMIKRLRCLATRSRWVHGAARALRRAIFGRSRTEPVSAPPENQRMRAGDHTAL